MIGLKKIGADNKLLNPQETLQTMFDLLSKSKGKTQILQVNEVYRTDGAPLNPDFKFKMNNCLELK